MLRTRRRNVGECVSRYHSLKEITMCFEFEWLYWAQLAQEREREEAEKAAKAADKTSPTPARVPQPQEQPVSLHA
jgi:hypothetical protein